VEIKSVSGLEKCKDGLKDNSYMLGGSRSVILTLES